MEPYSYQALRPINDAPRRVGGRAIWFCDVVNSTSLIEKRERDSITRIQDKISLLNTRIESLGGNVVKSLGDGSFAVFRDPVTAVYVGLLISSECGPQMMADIRLRIGIDYGSVFLKENDYFGHHVNLASRLQIEAPVGGMAVSKTVYNRLPKDVKSKFESKGLISFKGIDKPLQVFSYEIKLKSDNLHGAVTDNAIRKQIIKGKVKRIAKWTFGIVLAFALMSVLNFIFPPNQKMPVPKVNGAQLLAIENFAYQGESSESITIREGIAGLLLDNNLAIFNLNRSLDSIPSLLNHPNQSSIRFILSGNITILTSDNQILRWQLNDLNSGQTIGIGRMKLESDDDYQALCNEITYDVISAISLDTAHDGK